MAERKTRKVLNGQLALINSLQKAEEGDDKFITMESQTMGSKYYKLVNYQGSANVSDGMKAGELYIFMRGMIAGLRLPEDMVT